MSKKSQIQIAIDELTAKWNAKNQEAASLLAAIEALEHAQGMQKAKKPRERKPRAVVPPGSAA